MSCSVDSGTYSVDYSSQKGYVNSSLYCPQCNQIFKEPVLLPCGHSLCNLCSATLIYLFKSKFNSTTKNDPIKKNKIRMGIANYNKVNGLKAKASKTSLKDKSFESCLDFKSPQCPTCLAGPSLATPIRNHVLDEVIKYAVKLEQIQKSLMKQDTKNFHYDQRFNNSGAISPAPSVLSSGYGHSEESDHYQSCDSRSLNDTGDESTFKIQDFKVLVIGGDKTGKTELVETQLLNDAFYGTNPDTDTTICLENLVEANNYCDLSAKYMLQLIDSTNYEKDLDKVDGVALVYSVTNRYSLLEAHHYYCMIMEKKGINIPMVLIGLKSDADNRRVVCYNEGMVFAKELNLPFHEISSRQNVGLTEAFSSLIEVYDRMM